MGGAATLCSAAAMRTGAGIVWLSSPGADALTDVTEVVGRPLPSTGWATGASDGLERFGALLIGPGLGRADTNVTDLAALAGRACVPLLIDGDGLVALAAIGDGPALMRSRRAGTILTPHDGEYRTLMGESPGTDRMDAARRLATHWCSVVVLKGATTTVASPTGSVRIVTEGDERLATAGTGDVLSGIISALLAAGLEPFDAAAGGAWIHGHAGRMLRSAGLVASDLLGAIPAVLGELA